MIRMKLSDRDLSVFRDSLKLFSENLKRDADDALSAAGRDYANKVREHIGTHDPFVDTSAYGTFWKRLSDAWIQTKASRGGSMEIWSETGGIYRSTRVHALPMSVFSGINAVQDPEAYDKAINNEFGTLWLNKRVPARPLFMPVANAMKEEYSSGNGVYRYFVDALKIAVRRTWAT